VLVTIAGTVTRNRTAAGQALPSAITVGYDRAFLVAGVLIAISAAAVLVLFRKRTAGHVSPVPDNGA
jgi:uncharacterized membrane-anchored protein